MCSTSQHIGGRFGHSRQREAPIRAEAVSVDESSVVLVKVKCEERMRQGSFEIAWYGIDPAKLWQFVWSLSDAVS